ncbi:phosphatidylglycerol lysyltransferase [Scopulibacillus darangshiensis]|uniref:Phosphatidylglycerol lysyltransferase n=1 Tax=Scopulibacillus darangshiensis TaxID=442528 RepID=A0A4R2P7P5_9BACL|nr:bifunctional lysylphosphatidylglycerol flippase/synthetase MprF [Scopulibacillus darangshiensis]TCP30923.1 phosphatidylglycerol lysyltransferase [Scopulibacillus darangshiensis]
MPPDIKKKLLMVGKVLFPILLIIFIYIQGRRELSGLSLRDSMKAILALPTGGFVVIIICGLLAISFMFFYDLVMIRSIKLPVPFLKIFRVSWIANSFNGLIGFGGLAGAGMRAILYKEHTEQKKNLLKSIGWMTPAMLNGLSILSFLAIIGIIPIHALLASEKWLWPVIIGVILFAPAYALYPKFKQSDTASLKLTLKYSVVSLAEWLAAAGVLFVILKLIGLPLTLSQVLGVFVVAAVTGLISLVPGGFGSFDLMFLIGMQAYDVEKGMVLTALLMYRIVYYFIPFVIGLVFAATEMTGTVMKKIEENRVFTPAIETTNVMWSLQRQLFQRLGYLLFSLITISISLWIFLNVTLEIVLFKVNDEGFMILSRPLMFLCYALLLGVSLTLFFRAKEMYFRTKRALYMVNTLLIISFVLGILVLSLWISVVSFIAFIFLFVMRKQFVRVSSPFTLYHFIKIFILSILAMWLYSVLIHSFLSLVNGDQHLLVYFYEIAAVALIFAFFFTLLFVFIFNKSQQGIPGEPPDFDKLKTFLEEHGGHVLSHLGFLGDKRFFFSSDGKALLQFAKIGNRLVVLGDPSGDRRSLSKVVQEFNSEADLYGYQCIYYQINGENLAVYHDLGYQFFKLGEEALVSLDDFTTAGKKNAGLRATLNRFAREGYTFDIVTPPFSDDFIHGVKKVSDEWLGRKREKGFSLGYFDKTYLSQAPIATLSDKDGNMIAFMSLMPVYQAGELSIDLMRYVPHAPSGIMDALFIQLFQWAKEEGYNTFNMGMAPLSNVGQHQYSFVSERIAAAIFNNVNYMYSFSGLRRFKQKYHPVWKGKYLAYRSTRSLPGTMWFVTHLISKENKKAVETEQKVN